MHPTKSMIDYMTEMNRLFPSPRSNENDVFRTPSPANSSLQSPYKLSTTVQSSSSTDSTSPESFPDIQSHRLTPSYVRPIYDQSIYDTPIVVKKQRAIIGRKIMGNSEHLQLQAKFDQDITFSSPIWQPEDSIVPQITPSSSKIFIQQKNLPQNVFYELFPNETAGFEVKTPVRTSVSPASCESSNFSTTSINTSRFSSHFSRPNLTMSGPSSSRYSDASHPKMCTFCRKNGETPFVYMTHCVKEKVGNRSIVTCPILRSHVCSTCGASGDNAHTITYCPVLRSGNNGQPLQSTTIMLKNTPVKSNGRRRYQH